MPAPRHLARAAATGLLALIAGRGLTQQPKPPTTDSLPVPSEKDAMAAKRQFAHAILDALTYAGNLSTIEDVLKNPRCTFHPGHIQDPCVVEGLIQSEKITHIVNFAAQSEGITVDDVIRKLLKAVPKNAAA
mgnify:CR=1 FL=1